jgi:hypothetical protein
MSGDQTSHSRAVFIVSPKSWNRDLSPRNTPAVRWAVAQAEAHCQIGSVRDQDDLNFLVSCALGETFSCEANHNDSVVFTRYW